MLYLIGIQRQYRPIKYTVFETITLSVENMTLTKIRELSKFNSMSTMNFSIKGQRISMNAWPHDILSKQNSNKLILLTKTHDSVYRLIDLKGKVKNVGYGEFQSIIHELRIANCDMVERYNEGKGVQYSFRDSYVIPLDAGFKHSVEIKYNIFRSKALTLGLDISFDYILEGENVKLVKYTGTSKKVILPNFITAICNGAFKFKHINELTLNAGLRHIGSGAFTHTGITYVEIPKNTEFMSEQAFDKTTKIVRT